MFGGGFLSSYRSKKRALGHARFISAFKMNRLARELAFSFIVEIEEVKAVTNQPTQTDHSSGEKELSNVKVRKLEWHDKVA